MSIYSSGFEQNLFGLLITCRVWFSELIEYNKITPPVISCTMQKLKVICVDGENESSFILSKRSMDLPNIIREGGVGLREST